MATNIASRRYRTWYAMLLRLYPRPFRERFGEGMVQVFHDLSQERKGSRRGLFGFALWIFCETLVGIVKENTTHMPQLGKTMLRVALGAMAVLMVPLVASQFVEDWNWPVGAFVGSGANRPRSGMMAECNGSFRSKHCSRDDISTGRSSSSVSAGTRVLN